MTLDRAHHRPEHRFDRSRCAVARSRGGRTLGCRKGFLPRLSALDADATTALRVIAHAEALLGGRLDAVALVRSTITPGTRALVAAALACLSAAVATWTEADGAVSSPRLLDQAMSAPPPGARGSSF